MKYEVVEGISEVELL